MEPLTTDNTAAIIHEIGVIIATLRDVSDQFQESQGLGRQKMHEAIILQIADLCELVRETLESPRCVVVGPSSQMEALEPQ